MNTISTLTSDWESAGITTTEEARDRLIEDLSESLVLEMDEDQSRVLAFRYVLNFLVRPVVLTQSTTSNEKAAGSEATEFRRDRLAEDLSEKLIRNMDEDGHRVLAVRYVKRSASSALAGLI